MHPISTYGLTVVLVIASMSGMCGSPHVFGGDSDPKFGVVYHQIGSTKLHADVYTPKGTGPFPAVLCIHGGAWVVGHPIEMIGISQALAKAGYVAVSIEYRLAPKDPFPAQIEDCRTALAWLQRQAPTYKVDPTRIAVWGYSAGAHLAALLALEQKPSQPGLHAGDDPRRIKAIVAGGTPCEFRLMKLDDPTYAFWLGGTRRERPETYATASPAAFVSADDPPILLYHGDADLLVNVSQARAMVERFKVVGVPVELFTIPGAGHIQVFFSSSTYKKGIEFLDQYLKPTAPLLRR